MGAMAQPPAVMPNGSVAMSGVPSADMSATGMTSTWVPTTYMSTTVMPATSVSTAMSPGRPGLNVDQRIDNRIIVLSARKWRKADETENKQDGKGFHKILLLTESTPRGKGAILMPLDYARHGQSPAANCNICNNVLASLA